MTPVVRTGPSENRHLLIAVIAAVAVALGVGTAVVLTATGGGGGGGAPKPKFLAQAEAVCATANGPALAVTKPTTYPDLAAAVGTIATAATGEAEQLRHLTPPKGADGPAVAAVYLDLDATAEAGKTLQAAATARDDAATVTATAAFAGRFNTAAVQAKAFGFNSCGTGLQPAVDAVFGGSQAILKTSFIAKAEALCRAGARILDGIPEPKSNDPRLYGQYLDKGLAVVDKMLSDLTALPLPPGEEQTVKDMIAGQGKVNSKLHELRDAAMNGDYSNFVAAEHELSTLTTAADAKFDVYGLGVCGSNFGES